MLMLQDTAEHLIIFLNVSFSFPVLRTSQFSLFSLKSKSNFCAVVVLNNSQSHLVLYSDLFFFFFLLPLLFELFSTLSASLLSPEVLSCFPLALSCLQAFSSRHFDLWITPTVTLSSTRHLIVPKAETQWGHFWVWHRKDLNLYANAFFVWNLSAYLHCCSMFSERTPLN